MFKLTTENDGVKNTLGFGAQEVNEALPKKFEAVANTKSDNMAVNYGKMSACFGHVDKDSKAK